MAQCLAINKNGSQCGSEALPGSQYCYLKSHQKQCPRWSKELLDFLRGPWNALILTIIDLGLAILAFNYYFGDKAIEAMVGKIKNQGVTSIKYVSVGATRFKVDSPDGVLFTDGKIPLLSLKISNDKLFVSTIIRDNTGEIIAELQDNTWKINPGKMFDRNYTHNILEVKNNAGKIALQAVHFGDTVHLAGIFRCKSGQTVTISPKSKGDEGSKIEIRPPGIENQYDIPPICKYPSELYFGSCPGIESLERLVRSGQGSYHMTESPDFCRPLGGGK